jgi:hypothetical protein
MSGNHPDVADNILPGGAVLPRLISGDPSVKVKYRRGRRVTTEW